METAFEDTKVGMRPWEIFTVALAENLGRWVL